VISLNDKSKSTIQPGGSGTAEFLAKTARGRRDDARASYDKALNIKPDYRAAADNCKLLQEELNAQSTSARTRIASDEPG